MKLKPVELFLALGLASSMVACSSPTTETPATDAPAATETMTPEANPAATPSDAASPTVTPAEEGGEGGEG